MLVYIHKNMTKDSETTEKEPFYITTTLPYVNGEPHIGFAGEIITADVRARYERSVGKDVFFNTGTDEHGVKILEKAEKNGVEPQIYVDEAAEKLSLIHI